MKKLSNVHKVLVGIGFVAFGVSAAGVAGAEEAEEYGVSAEALSTAEEVTEEGASELVAAAGKCRARCCDGSVSHVETTSSKAVCIQWGKSFCQFRDGARWIRFNGQIVWAGICN